MTNHGRTYSEKEVAFLDQISKMIKTREQMEFISPLIAEEFGRTLAGIQKQIENRKDWYFKG